ncbi:hypothetical protein BJX64DRAFT_257665 [Aspergillus heterothallicus]
MASGDVSPSLSLGKPPNFKRVYQACENCRRKKQRCNLGDPACPEPPCHSCRRANLPCVLPKQKRKGRPPKALRSNTAATTPRTSDLEQQPAWETSMGSFEPVVETSPPRSGDNLGLTKPTSYDHQIASQRLVTYPLRNTSDAIRLLDQADVNPNEQIHPVSDVVSPTGHAFANLDNARPTFYLLVEGLIDETTLISLFKFYIESVHPIIPMVPYKRRQTTPEHILTMAGREPHFMSAILVVTASIAGDQALHDRLWQRVQSLFAEVAIKGETASIQVIEGLILLSEYPPNMGHGRGLGFEDRMSWMTVGTAVRLGYLLGLEKLGMQADEMDEKLAHDFDRGKVAWSYCFTLDRQISIRVGKTFWHRSPGMTIQHLRMDPAEDFPELREIPGVQDDYAAYLQCLVYITHVLSNAHDLLYPSKNRSAALARSEHYYKHIDEFAETLSAFRSRWQKKVWLTYPINECVWISFHHLRLYIYSFSLQAYMQRASGGRDVNPSLNYFPAGLMGSSDARFIIEAINAAADILRLAIGRLQPSKALSYIPLRFFLFFSHAGVFLLKAAVIVPLPSSQKRAILRLIRALTKCMSTASSDPRHPGVRYSSALSDLLGRLYRDQDLQTPSITRPPSPHTVTRAVDDRTDLGLGNAPAGENTLPALLEDRESTFIAERPFQDLASDIDALFGLEPNYSSFTPQTAGEPYTHLPQAEPFSLLFGSNDREFWESFTSSSFDWSTIQGDVGNL